MKPDIGKVHLDITFEPGGTLKALLFRYNAPKVIERLVRKLPIRKRVKIYKGSQIFVSVGVGAGLEKGTSTVDKGDIAYWPVGDAFCIYRDKMDTYSKVNVLGKIIDGLDLLAKIEEGTIITINNTKIISEES
ncbi:MAG: cyclophilin-like fold protein [Candidatus Ranarchaeia archaeon]